MNESTPIYLDYHATTPVDPRVAAQKASTSRFKAPF
jgi:cysteine sulfinate desulfinase/cysteine desulfurase-like protein